MPQDPSCTHAETTPYHVLYVIYITHSRYGDLQQTPEFLFAVCQFFRPQIFAISHQQVECEKARLTAMKEPVTELGPATLV